MPTLNTADNTRLGNKQVDSVYLGDNSVWVADPFEPWPDLANEGAGTDHLREPLPEGWPAIVADPVYGFRPEFWVPVKTIWVTEEEDNSRKQVMVWQPDYETDEFVYNWNMVRGFYVTDTQMEAEEEEWIKGEEMEIPIEDPSP